MQPIRVGRQTAGFLRRGHPWVRQDRYLGSFANLSAGEPITLVDERGKPLASALADPRAADGIVARVYDSRPDRPFNPAHAMQRAAQIRQKLRQDHGTTCFRLVHGEADFLPGVRVECYGATAVLLLRSHAAHAHQAELVRALAATLGHDDIIIRHQLSDLRRQDVVSSHLSGRPVDPTRIVVAKELGLTYEITPENDLATGIYVDQRATRVWLQECIRQRLETGQTTRVTNLFAYTGLFSCAALAAGATSAIDIDLSGPALATARTNAKRNGLADRHQTVQSDCLSALQKMPAQSVDILICDPPTAAGGNTGKDATSRKQKGWVVKRDYPTLLQACGRVLAPGGILVACCNTLGRKAFDLAAASTRIGKPLDGPQLGIDIPQRRGFPEGRPFQMVTRYIPP